MISIVKSRNEQGWITGFHCFRPADGAWESYWRSERPAPEECKNEPSFRTWEWSPSLAA